MVVVMDADRERRATSTPSSPGSSEAGGEAFVSRGVSARSSAWSATSTTFRGLNLRGMPGVGDVDPGVHAVQAGQPRPPPRRATVVVGGVGAACPSGQTRSRSSPVRARSRRPSRPSKRPRWPRPPAPRCCAAAPSSRAPRPTPSRAWASGACRSWPRCVTRPAFPSSPRSSTRTTSRSWRRTPTCSRSAPATCRTSPCSRRSVGPASRCMLKRGMKATIEEWLMAAEYVAQRGNLDIVLCERGIRTFETATRNTLDIAAVPVVAAAVAPAGHRRPVALGRPARPGRCRWRGRRSPSAPTASSSTSTPHPRRRSATAPQALVGADLRALASAVRQLPPLVGRQPAQRLAAVR